MDEYEQINELLNVAFNLPSGYAQASAMKEAINIADSINDEEAQMFLRMNFIDAAFHAGWADEMLVAISWCLAATDKNPDRYDVPEVLDQMALGLAYVSSFDTITRSQIEGLLDDFQRRCEEHKIGDQKIYRERCFNAFWMGDLNLATQTFEKFMRPAVRVYEADCHWNKLFQSDYYIHVDQYQKAYETSRETLLNPNESMGAHGWLGSFMLPILVRLEKLDEAARAQKLAYTEMASNPKHIGVLAHHLIYASAIEDLSLAGKIMEKHLKWAMESKTARQKFQFYLAAWAFTVRLQQQQQTTIALFLPSEFEVKESAAGYQVSELTTWFQTATTDLAQKFNQRNGNQYFDKLVQDWLELVQ